MKKQFTYENIWSKYTFPSNKTHIYSDYDIGKEFSTVKLGGNYPKGGIPLCVKDNNAVIVDDTSHTMIFGETGCGKTRSIVNPLIPILSCAGESMFVVDVKGEISTNKKVRGYLAEKNYKTVFIDFRTFSGDGYNILSLPFQLYCKDNHDKAMSIVNKIISSFEVKYNGTKADPFWQDMATLHIIGILELLFDCCSKKEEYKKYVNLLSAAYFCDEKSTNTLERFVSKINFKNRSSSNAINVLNNVLSAPDKTRMSIVSTTTSYLKDFMLQENMTKMLSKTTFSIKDMYEQPTCVFLIVPDETSAFDSIAALLIDLFYSELIEVFTNEYQNKKKPPCRVNFICDEMCNIKIQEVKAKVSASRSREIRWFFICQSFKQLQETYTDSTHTIIGNCKNFIFFSSSDPEMLEYISMKSGISYISENSMPQPLLPIEDLKYLESNNKYREAIFIRNHMVYKSALLDIDEYKYLEKYADSKFPDIENKLIDYEVETYDVDKMIEDISKKVICPYFIKNVSEKFFSNASSFNYLFEDFD